LNQLNQLRKQEKEFVREIKSYLNEKNEIGVRIDEDTFISISNQDKKINLTKKEYEQRVRDLLYKRKGIDDEEFTKELLNKTSDIIQQQKLKIKKDKDK
jgi:predicted RNA-binding protein with RPS1 domain